MSTIFLTGGSGFVGSNIAYVLRAQGHVVVAPSHHELDLTERDATVRAIVEAEADAVIHAAIWNDANGIYAARERAWDGYVGTTRNVIDGANALGVKTVLVSTDWVFDGLTGGYTEVSAPNPVNFYGVLKLASEVVLQERADNGAIARVSGVNGVHRARPQSPRQQDLGFGYFVASLVDAVRAGRTFEVWESPHINMRATPSLASECGRQMSRIIERDLQGVFHCCGGQPVSRRELAVAACRVFDLDDAQVTYGPPVEEDWVKTIVPNDVSLDARLTAERLSLPLLSVDELLQQFRVELDASVSVA